MCGRTWSSRRGGSVWRAWFASSCLFRPWDLRFVRIARLNILKVLHTPVEGAVVKVAAAFWVSSRVASRFHYVDFTAARPFSIDRVLGHHPWHLLDFANVYGDFDVQIAGQIQSPLGSLATTSTLP